MFIHLFNCFIFVFRGFVCLKFSSNNDWVGAYLQAAYGCLILHIKQTYKQRKPFFIEGSKIFKARLTYLILHKILPYSKHHDTFSAKWMQVSYISKRNFQLESGILCKLLVRVGFIIKSKVKQA